MIKLIHVISDSNIGGAGRYLLTYLRNYNRGEFDVSVAVPTGSQLIDPIRALDVPVHEIAGLAERSVSFPGVLGLTKLFAKEKPSIVHTHACLSARIAARLARTGAIVYTRHSVFPQKDVLTKGLGRAINGLVGRFLADGIIAVAEAAKQNLTDTGISPNLIEVIYNGVDQVPVLSHDEQQQVRRKFGIAPDEKVVAIIARLDKVKGHEYFISAANAVRDAGIKARFVIAGTGEEMETLKAFRSRNGLDDMVLFTGFLQQVGELENIMDLQVNTSYGTEAASLSLLEGMSLGKPAVVSDFGGNPELITSHVNGMVVPQQKVGALADAIIQVLTDEQMAANMQVRAKQVYDQRFTARLMTEQMELFYKKIRKQRVKEESGWETKEPS